MNVPSALESGRGCYTMNAMKFQIRKYACAGAVSAALAAMSAFAADTPAPTPAAAPSTNGIGPRIEFDNTVYDFGKAVAGAKIAHEFIFTNTGDAALEITSVIPGCHCTTAGDWTRHVAPGATGVIPLTFDSKGVNGPVVRAPRVLSNDRKHPETALQIKGTVWVPFQVNPSYSMIQFPYGSTEPRTNVVHIQSSIPEPVQLWQPVSSNPAITATLQTNEAGHTYELAIRAAAPTHPGAVQGTITIQTTSAESPVLSVPVMLIPAPPPRPAPPQIRTLTNTPPPPPVPMPAH